MKIMIEIVADSREDVLTLLSDAVAVLKRGREHAGEVNSCIGDYRITVEDPPEPPIPFAEGDRVRFADADNGAKGTVQHSGPRMTGVRWDRALDVDIRPNVELIGDDATQGAGEDRDG